METISIIISIVALLVSISSFQWNKAKHNLNQLTDNANKFCNSLQEFIELGTEHCLTLYKYEIENLYLLQDIEKRNIAYNDLQIEFSKRKDNCQQKYKKVLENLDFLEIQGILGNNEFLKLLNKTLNDYYLKLNKFYGDLFDINLVVGYAYRGLITAENKAIVNSFFSNIRDLLDYNVAFSVFKRDFSGYFSKLSLIDVGLFGNNQKVLKKIEINLLKYIKNIGFEEAICKKDYSKIRKHCFDFGEEFDSFINEEKSYFIKFLNSVKDFKNKI